MQDDQSHDAQPRRSKHAWNWAVRGHFGGLRPGSETTVPHLLAQYLRSQPFDDGPPPVIVDLGSGLGLVAEWLQDRGFRVLGLEVSEQYVEEARKRAESADRHLLPSESPEETLAVLRRNDRPFISYQLATLAWKRPLKMAVDELRDDPKAGVSYNSVDIRERIPLPAAAVDAVGLHRTLNMMADPEERERLVAEVFRILKPGGFVSFLDFRRVRKQESDGAWYAKRYATSRDVLRQLGRLSERRAHLGEDFPRLFHRPLQQSGTDFVLAVEDQRGRAVDETTLSSDQLVQEIQRGTLVLILIAVHPTPATQAKLFQGAGFEILRRQSAEVESRHGAHIAPLSGFIAQKPRHPLADALVATVAQQSLQKVDQAKLVEMTDSIDDRDAIAVFAWALQSDRKEITAVALERLAPVMLRNPAALHGLALPYLLALVALEGVPELQLLRDMPTLTVREIRTLANNHGVKISDDLAESLFRATRGVELIATQYAEDLDLGKDCAAVVTVKNTGSVAPLFADSQTDLPVQDVIRTPGRTPTISKLVVGRDEARDYYQGHVFCTTLDGSEIDPGRAMLRTHGFRAIEPFEVSFCGDQMVLAGGNVLTRIDLASREVRQRRPQWFGHLHGVDFSPDGSQLLVASSGYDVAIELTWDHDRSSMWFAWEHGYEESLLGHRITRSRDTAGRWLEDGFDPRRLMFLRRPGRHEPFGLPVTQRPAHLNGAHYVGGHEMLATLFHRGSGIIVDLKTGKVREQITGLQSPHDFVTRPHGGYRITDTRRARLILMNEAFQPVRQIMFNGLPGDQHRKEPTEWLQHVSWLGGDLHVAVDNHRSRIWLLDIGKRTYRGLTFPHHWWIQQVKRLPEHWTFEMWAAAMHLVHDRSRYLRLSPPRAGTRQSRRS